jgi:hypothetical protein
MFFGSGAAVSGPGAEQSGDAPDGEVPFIQSLSFSFSLWLSTWLSEQSQSLESWALT